MAKYAGLIGYAIPKVVSPGVVEDTIVEHKARGDVTYESNQIDPKDNVVKDFELRQRISIVADKYAYTNFQYMRYVTYMGVKWSIKSVSVKRPRLELSIGGVWNGN